MSGASGTGGTEGDAHSAQGRPGAPRTDGGGRAGGAAAAAAAAAAAEGGPVVFVIGTTSGGTGRHVRMLTAGLTARGADVTVCGPATAGQRFGFARAGAAFVPVEIADRPRPARDAAAVLRLRRLLPGRVVQGPPLRGPQVQGPQVQGPPEQGPPQQGGPVGSTRPPGIVHAHGLRAGALAALALRPLALRPRATGAGGRAARRARPRARPALVVTLHNAPPGPGLPGAIYRLLEGIVARRADMVLCVSADLEERIRRRGARCARRAVVPAPAGNADGDHAAVDASVLRATLGAAGRPLVLAAGRLAPQKGFGTLLDAAAGWRGRCPEPLVLIAGDGPLAARLQARIEAERLPARLLGHRDDVPELMAAADVLVLPSAWEGQPLFVQEALRAAKPLVATRVGGVPDLTGEDAAVLVPPGDPGRLAGAVLRVLDSPALADRLRTAARLRARSLPSGDEAISAVIAEYRRLGRGRG